MKSSGLLFHQIRALGVLALLSLILTLRNLIVAVLICLESVAISGDAVGAFYLVGYNLQPGGNGSLVL